jgi:hypothetical protein
MAPVGSECALFSQLVAPGPHPFRVDQDVGDVVHIAHLMEAFAHLQERVEAGGERAGGIDEEAVRELRAPAGGELPVLALDVVDDGRARPGEEGGHDQPDALAGAGGGHGQHVLGAVVAQVAAVADAEHDALAGEEPGVAHVGQTRPVGRAIGGGGRCTMAGPPGGSP